MSSSITYGFQLLADYPDVLAKVREEQTRVRAGDFESPISLAMVEQMTYTNAVVKEILRYRPPVIMVPYLAKKDFKIDDNYTVPKGTMIIPSFWNVSPATGLLSPNLNPSSFSPIVPPSADLPRERTLSASLRAVSLPSSRLLPIHTLSTHAHRCVSQVRPGR